ncbi:SGNH/GDSL hydrolase family protein [Novosphingobium sp. MW5]|nr:SGNH/GDSL hydrolase family protein [Novosphingobium sp. MW5]
MASAAGELAREMAMGLWRSAIVFGAFAASLGAAEAKPQWREAFHSSPASYEAPAEEFIKFASENWHVPEDNLRANLTPQPVSGTIRYRVTLQAGGSEIRIRLSNEEGKAPVLLKAVSVGLAADAFSAKAGSLRSVTFGGRSSATIPAGAPLVSDALKLPVQPGSSLVVSLATATTILNEGRGSAGFVVAEGDQTLREVLDQPKPLVGRPLVTSIAVLGKVPRGIIVTFGDSITDGNRAKPDALRGWPEVLARRLAARKGGGSYTVLNAGISGNRLLARSWGNAGLARLDRDALRIEGVTHLILLEGINDINFSGRSPFGTNPEITADDLISGYRQVIARAHARGIKVYIGTLTPQQRDEFTTAAKIAIRDSVNHWIRTSGEPDRVIDFDAMVRDPTSPAQFKAEFDSGDHLHPGDKGYERMGSQIDLSLFP